MANSQHLFVSAIMVDEKKQLFLFPDASKRDAHVAAWLDQQNPELGSIAKHWFEVMRGCGDDVRELLHDGHPTACVNEAAFAYVNVFTHHVNVGFFCGAELDDPQGLLLGTGKRMRHVKLSDVHKVEPDMLRQMIERAYQDMRNRLKRSE